MQNLGVIAVSVACKSQERENPPTPRVPNTMPQRTVPGICRLCRQKRNLQNSHIWPSFGYRDFVADQSKGGAFINLETERYLPKQIRRYWYCSDCEAIFSKTEKYAKELIARFVKDDSQLIDYSAELHAFCVSICLRTIEYCHDPKPFQRRSKLARAHLAWREYLLRKRSDVNPYTVHQFLLFDKSLGLHKAMGGHIYEEENIVICQVGPLFVASPLDRSALSIRDLRVWEHTQVYSAGGALKQWEIWKPDQNITSQLFSVLGRNHRYVIARIKSRPWAKQSRS